MLSDLKLRQKLAAAFGAVILAIAAVTANVAAIRSSAGEINQASDDLARRTEQQSASLEETAAALDQIATAVHRTAGGARQAADVVQRTRGEAEASDVVVSEAVAAMTAIEQSSNQMDQATQQNAAMVEESTAASHSLTQEADVLAVSAAHFRTTRAAAKTAPTPKAAAPARVMVQKAPEPAAEPVLAHDPASTARTPQPVAETVAALRTMGRGGAALKPEIIEDGWEKFL